MLEEASRRVQQKIAKEGYGHLTESGRVSQRTILPFQRLGARLGKRNPPKVGLGGSHELNPKVLLAVAITPGRYHPALNRLSRIFVHQNQGLVRRDFRVHRNQTAKLADRVGLRSDDELLSRHRLPVNSQWHRQRNARRSPSFDSPVTHNLHLRANSVSKLLPLRAISKKDLRQPNRSPDRRTGPTVLGNFHNLLNV